MTFCQRHHRKQSPNSHPEVGFWRSISHTRYILQFICSPRWLNHSLKSAVPSLKFHYVKITAASFTFLFLSPSSLLSPLFFFFSPSHFGPERRGCIEWFPLHKISIREFADCAALLQKWWWCFFFSVVFSPLGPFSDIGLSDDPPLHTLTSPIPP